MINKPTRETLNLKGALEKLGIRVLKEVDDGHKHIDLSIPSARINIEIDGDQHITDSHQILKDLNRTHYSDDLGYDTLHISNHSLNSNLGGIASAVAEASKIREEEFDKIYKNKPMYKGIIIEESLENNSIFRDVRITSTKVEVVRKEHRTPWVNQWTMHTVEIPVDKVNDVAEKISHALDSKHNWYADFKNSANHCIVFRNKVFMVDRQSKEQYEEAKKYGISLGIPEYQVDFHPNIKQWNG